MDIMPTLIEASSATYPLRNTAGKSCLWKAQVFPVFRGKEIPQRTIGFDHQGACGSSG